MFRRFFSFQEDPPLDGTHNGNGNGLKAPAVAVAEPPNEVLPEPRPQPQPPVVKAVEKNLSFDQIYQTATVKPPAMTWGILKVAEMVDSPHLAGMSPEAKRCSVLMALDAAGAETEDLLQDAVVRQRALNDYEEIRKRMLKDLEAAKLAENRSIQAELDRLTAQHLARIQANLDELAAEQDRLHAWQKEKHVEALRITEAATYCVRQGGASGSSLTAVLERATRK